MSDDLLFQPAHEIAGLVRSRRVSAAEVARAFLDRIGAVDGRVRAFLSVASEPSAGSPDGPLAGVPVALKDNLCTLDAPTTCASKILENYRAPYEATAVARLRAAGATIIGKTNLDEFAMGSSTENSARFPSRNPWDLERVPGGSSGGSAAAVAAGLAAAGLGSDTGGSIRQPAALCGVVGFKPTYGRVSRNGLIAFASSLDQVGPISRDVRDAALLMSVMGGHDPLDATSLPGTPPDYVGSLERDPRGIRIGLPKEYFSEGLDAEVRARVMEALRLLEKRGARLVEVALPMTRFGISTYYIVAPAEASSNLARYDGVHYGHRTAAPADLIDLVSRSRAEGFGPEVRRRIILGTFVLSSDRIDAYYHRAQKVRRLIARDFDQAFENCDVIAGPTSPTAAFRVGEKASDPLSMYLCDVYTVGANLAGLPGVSVPCGFTSGGLPVGLQILGRPLDDLAVLQTARAVERELGPSGRKPAL
ncbi:MAG TPA: Asp-tRNA(Asn)/Glu-tRNA(Gln) amidotransferase subunit GatA [Planctomycetota bacterium]|nr:Asp-tRNA(Asn)/Glu-tRNA(Gln) amidotransferase subunit GatA [Planctomycetota bacterium]